MYNNTHTHTKKYQVNIMTNFLFYPNIYLISRMEWDFCSSFLLPRNPPSAASLAYENKSLE